MNPHLRKLIMNKPKIYNHKSLIEQLNQQKHVFYLIEKDKFDASAY